MSGLEPFLAAAATEAGATATAATAAEIAAATEAAIAAEVAAAAAAAEGATTAGMIEAASAVPSALEASTLAPLGADYSRLMDVTNSGYVVPQGLTPEQIAAYEAATPSLLQQSLITNDLMKNQAIMKAGTQAQGAFQQGRQNASVTGRLPQGKAVNLVQPVQSLLAAPVQRRKKVSLL